MRTISSALGSEEFIMSDEKTTATCLFTGEALDDSTIVEHTIPESLGGRVKSTLVAGTRFNNAWGSSLVPAIKKPYALLMSRLGSLLPGAHRSGMIRVDVPGEVSGLVLDDEGVLTRQGISIVCRDPETNRPRSVVGENERELRKLLRTVGAKDDQMVMSFVNATEATNFFVKAPVIWKDLEIAALVSILLTFDHLTNATEYRFTRSEVTVEIRRMIEQVVLQNQPVDGDWLNSISLGMQYEKLELYKSLRSRAGTPESPFEHTLIASANLPTQTLDLVWNAFGFDPFGFRIHGWQSESFTLVFTNPILHGTHASDLKVLPESMLLCSPTNRRAFPDSVTESDMTRAMNEVSDARSNAWGDVVHHVEMSADEFIISNLKLSGDLAGIETPMKKLVQNRLIRMYGRMAEDNDFVKFTHDLVEKQIQNVLAPVAVEVYVADTDGASITWDQWLAVYRTCLTETTSSFGKPGDSSVKDGGMFIGAENTNTIGNEPKY